MQPNIIDLHQDWSDNALCTTHKDFFSEEINHGRNCEENMEPCNQVDYRRLKLGNVSAVIAAVFIDPDSMNNFHMARFELNRHLKYYDRVVKQSNGEIYNILSGGDISDSRNGGKIGLLKHLEGFYFLDPNDTDFSILDELYQKGIRSIGLTWSNNTNISCGNSGTDSGISDLGLKFLEQLKAKKIIIDLAHSSKKSFKSAIEILKKPMMISHTKITDRQDLPRFTTAEQARKIADLGGLIGIMTMKDSQDSMPIQNLSDYVMHLLMAISIVGEDHVAIGTDFDGLTQDHIIQGFEDVSKTSSLYEEMKRQGFTEMQIEKIFYRNAIAFINQNI